METRPARLLPMLPVLVISIMLSSCAERNQEIIYDEKDVPRYVLPVMLETGDGESISTAGAWEKKRKGEILNIFEKEMYGSFPSDDYSITFEEVVRSDSFLDGKAIMKEVFAFVETGLGKHNFTMLLVLPKKKEKVPVFCGLNFYGNHTTDTSGLITIHDRWVRNSEEKQTSENRATEESRGTSTERWPFAQLVLNGYGCCTAYYGEFDPDYDDGFQNGLHPLFAASGNLRDQHSAAAISAWARGMSMMMDYLQSDSLVDAQRIISVGHSRLGKTSLWAGANDARFAGVVSNNSGCGGAALSRRGFGETVEVINGYFPHWFCDRFKIYNGKEHRLPVDQHMLIALIAPRPVYVASATEDLWADPKGEFLSLKEAGKVYDLYARDPDFPELQPQPDEPYHGIRAYHLRTGKHNITPYDWEQYMRWAEQFVKP